MSEKFSVEDILNEVKAMTDSHYISAKPKASSQKRIEKATVESRETDQLNFFDTADDAPKTEVPKKEKPKKRTISEMSTEEFFNLIEKNTKESSHELKEEKSNSEETGAIIGGFKIKNSAQSEPEPESKPDFEPKEEVKVSDYLNEGNTITFSKDEVKKAIEEQKEIKAPEFSEKAENSEDNTVDNDIINEKIELKNHRFKEHKPDHLLSVEEILNDSMNNSRSLRFNNKVKDLTKKSDESENNIDSHIDIIEEKINEQEKEQQVELENFLNEKLGETKEKEIDIIEEDSFEKKEERPEPVDINSNNVNIPVSGDIDYHKYIDEDELKFKKEAVEKEKKHFVAKTSRKVVDYTIDYTDDTVHEDEVIDDYCNIEDEEPVKYDLDLSLKKVSRRITANIILFILAFVVTVLPTFDMAMISALSPTDNFTGFLIANTAILLAAVLVNAGSIFRGLFSLFTFRPDGDSSVAVASCFVIAQTAVAFVPEMSADLKKLPFFTASLIFGFIMTLLGKKSMVSRIKANFRLVANQSVKKTCFTADDRMSELLPNDYFIGLPNVTGSKSVVNLHNYLKNSYCEDPSDSVTKLFSAIGTLVSLVTLAILYFTTGNLSLSISFATAVAVISAPVSVILAVNSPIKKASEIFREREGLISGYGAIEEFSESDCVVLNSEDLFPAGSVELMTIQAIGDFTIEDVILKSAALTINAGGPLSNVFDKIIDGRRKMLPPVSDIVYEDGLGLTGKVEGKTVRIGNYKFIDSYGIAGLTDYSLEEKAKAGGYFIVYTAIDNEVCGMFAVKYKSIDPDIEDGVYELVNSGIALAVKTNDPNITPELIESVFEIPAEFVIIMPSHSVEYYENIARPAKCGNGLLAYPPNKFSCYAMLISACKKLKTKISVAVLLQSIFTVLGFAVCMFYAVTKGSFDIITPLNIIIYQLAVSILTRIITSLIKKVR